MIYLTQIVNNLLAIKRPTFYKHPHPEVACAPLAPPPDAHGGSRIKVNSKSNTSGA